MQKQEDLSHFVQNMQIKQQFYGQGAAMASTNLIKVNRFLTENFNLKHDLFSSDEELQQFIDQAGQMAQQGALPQPRTAASSVQLPKEPGVTI